jgi:hypothetical protein
MGCKRALAPHDLLRFFFLSGFWFCGIYKYVSIILFYGRPWTLVCITDRGNGVRGRLVLKYRETALVQIKF